MTDYEYIITQCRKYHFTKWDDEELRKCVDKLAGLPRQELTALYYSRWVKDDKVFRESVFNTLFKDKVGLREKRIKEADIKDLIEEFQDKQSGNVSLIRKEMRERYKDGRDKQEIIMAFNHATKNDQSWVKWQLRKERYGRKK